MNLLILTFFCIGFTLPPPSRKSFGLGKMFSFALSQFRSVTVPYKITISLKPSSLELCKSVRDRKLKKCFRTVSIFRASVRRLVSRSKAHANSRLTHAQTQRREGKQNRQCAGGGGAFLTTRCVRIRRINTSVPRYSRRQLKYTRGDSPLSHLYSINLCSSKVSDSQGRYVGRCDTPLTPPVTA